MKISVDNSDEIFDEKEPHRCLHLTSLVLMLLDVEVTRTLGYESVGCYA